jgi:uncharacterized membrane protein YvbJ
MSISRKCPKCSTWNGDNDYCTSCGHLLNYAMQLEQEERDRSEAKRNRIPDPLEQFFIRWKASKNILVRVAYYIVFSIWFVLFAFFSFLMSIIFLGPG